MTQIQLPKNFLFGAATSAAQIEGGAFLDGRGASVWDTFAGQVGTIADGTTPSVSCDFYHNYKEDLALAKNLGLQSFRFSFSWSRIFPEGTGKANEKGLDFYKRVIDEIHKNNIIPNATIYHWDLPQALEEKGGWINRDIVQWYGEYASLLFREFGNSVPFWATVNEPIATYVGYAQGIFAPGHVSERMGRQANHHVLLSHGEGVQRFRQENIKDGKIGIVVDIWKHHPYRPDNPADCAMAELENEKTYRSYLNPLFHGRYTDALLRYMEKNECMPEIQDGDLEKIARPMDFFGLNCYNRVVDCADENLLEEERKKKHTGGNFQDNGFEFYPKAVYDAVKMLKKNYDLSIPIYVTENGTPGFHEKPDEKGCICDQNRIHYIKGFLYWIGKALEERYDIRGYYVWSLLDNWEWNSGFSSRYGLTYVDFDTQKRIIKESGKWYAKVIEERVIDWEINVHE
ncbi:MAG: GH1 family beta-glucosidase [Eubacteriales bacterium]|nr:GH1 family beta-glucosidase [Eubacteriales bacterium]